MNGHKIINQNSIHFITCTVVGWVDVFTRQIYRDVIIDSLKHCKQNKGLKIYAYVVMSNHLHLIVSTNEDHNLSDTLRDFKTFTSKQIIKTILENNSESRQEWMVRLFKYHAKFNSNNSKFQFWKKDNRPIELESPKWISTKINYIHNNPVNAGLVEKPEHYLYSSASNYVNSKGLIDVEVVDLGFDIGYVS